MHGAGRLIPFPFLGLGFALAVRFVVLLGARIAALVADVVIMVLLGPGPVGNMVRSNPIAIIAARGGVTNMLRIHVT